MRAYAADGGVPTGDDRAKRPSAPQYLLDKLIEAPDTYLSFDGRQALRVRKRTHGQRDGFWSPRDGIVLTNAHVIGDAWGIGIRAIRSCSPDLIGPACDEFMRQTIQLFGGEPAADLRPQRGDHVSAVVRR